MNTTASRTSVPVIGHFDHVAEGKAHGWAYAPQTPGSRRTVEIVSSDKVVARGTADLLREDLARAGIGDGKHHFSMRLSYELNDGEVHTLTARDAETGITLAGGSHSFQSEPQPWAFDLMTRAQGLSALERELAQPGFAGLRSHASRLTQAYEYASLLQETGQLSTARSAYLMLGKHVANSALLSYKVGEVSLLEDDAQSALEAFETSLEADASQVWAHVGRGHALAKQQKLFDAEISWERAIALEPDFPGLRARLDALAALGLEGRVDLLVRQGLHAEARTLLTKRLLANADDEEAHALLGRFLSPHQLPADLPGMQPLSAHDEALRVLQHLLDTAESIRSAV